MGIHELLGHGTGKLLMVDSEGKKNWKEGLKNPVTGKEIESWYKVGETWDSKFQSFASTMEECRAGNENIFFFKVNLSQKFTTLEIYFFLFK